MFPDCSFQVGGDHAGFHNRDGVGKIDLLDPIHAHEGKRNPTPNRNTAPHVTVAGPACSDRSLILVSKSQQLADGVGRSGEDNNFRTFVSEPFVAAVLS